MSKVLADLSADACTPWQLPSVRASGDPRPVQTKAERQAIAEIHRVAHEEGFAAGHASGIEAVHQPVRDQFDRLSRILEQLTHQLSNRDDEVI